MRGALRWSRLSIRYKLFAIYFAVTVIPIFTLGYYLVSSLRASITRNVEQANASTMELLARGFRERIAGHVGLIDTLAYDDTLIAFVETDFADDWHAYEAYRRDIEKLFKSAEERVRNVQFKIYSGNRSLRLSTRFVSDPFLTGLDPARLAETGRKITWDGTLEVGGRRYLVCHTPMRKRSNPVTSVATLVTYLDCFELSTPFADLRAAGIPAFLVDGEGRTVLSSIGGEAPPGDGARRTVVRGDRSYLVLDLPLDDEALYLADWRIRYLAPLDLLNASVRRMGITTLALALLSGAAMVTIVSLFSRTFARRVDGLIVTMREFESGNRTARGRPGADEIGQLIGIFNEMADTIGRLISETLEARLRAQEAELERMRLEGARNEAQLQYLQSTINPHYLFNTLESIRMRTLLNGDRVTAKVIRIFARSFREVMASTEITVPLARELELVNAFVTIQRYRFGRRLAFTIRCEPGVEQERVPRFLLQPLVENAVFHGVEKKVGRGRVTVSLSREGSRVAVEVVDDGAGMSGERVREVDAAIRAAEPGASCAALRNIHQRLKILYGGDFSFGLQSAPGRGTRVRVLIPRR